MRILVCPRCGTKNRVEEQPGNLRPVCGKCHARLDASAGTGAQCAKVVSDASFPTDVLGVKGKPVLLDCWAPWCGPCRMLGSTIEKLAEESAGRWVVAKLNTDENPGVSSRFQIDSIPALLVFKDGQLVDRLVGVQPKANLERALMAHVR